mgnify:CR=1 FL=1
MSMTREPRTCSGYLGQTDDLREKVFSGSLTVYVGEPKVPGDWLLESKMTGI